MRWLPRLFRALGRTWSGSERHAVLTRTPQALFRPQQLTMGPDRAARKGRAAKSVGRRTAGLPPH